MNAIIKGFELLSEPDPIVYSNEPKSKHKKSFEIVLTIDCDEEFIQWVFAQAKQRPPRLG